MIYVLTPDYRRFQSFLQEFNLREHFGSRGNREGQCVYLGDPDRLRGVSRGIVLLWAGPHRVELEAEVRAIARFYDIPVLEVPDLRRIRHMATRVAEVARKW